MNTKNDTKLRERIRNLWTDKKGDLGLTQKIAANILNMSQPAFSNYLKEGGLPINTDFVLKFCSMMQVSPDVISTHFIDAGDIGVGLRRTNVKVTRTLTGKLMEAFISLSTANISEDVYAIKVDVVFDILKLGQYLIIDPNIKPREGDYVVKITDNRPCEQTHYPDTYPCASPRIPLSLVRVSTLLSFQRSRSLLGRPL